MRNTEKSPETIEEKRIYFLDNLRAFMIFLVVVIHAGGVYESSGTWGSFWIVDDPAANNAAGLVFLLLDIFVMPTLFFISGFLAPLSLKHKSRPAFLKSKFKRLIVPWAIAVLTLIPLYKIIFLASRGLPQEHWTTYFHFGSRSLTGQNWLWFLPVLFLFHVLYTLLSKIKINLSKISIKWAVLAVFVIGYLYSVGMSVLNLRGWTKTFLIDFQNERLGIYFMMYLLGALCFHKKIFDSKPAGKTFYIVINSIAWIPMNLYIILLVNRFVNPGSFMFSDVIDRLLIYLGFHLSLLSMLYVTVNTFRLYFNRQGRFARMLSENSYAVYIIHTIVLGITAWTLLYTAIPSLLKYVILIVATYAACNGIVSLYKKLIPLKLSLKRMQNSQQVYSNPRKVYADC